MPEKDWKRAAELAKKAVEKHERGATLLDELGYTRSVFPSWSNASKLCQELYELFTSAPVPPEPK